MDGNRTGSQVSGSKPKHRRQKTAKSSFLSAKDSFSGSFAKVAAKEYGSTKGESGRKVRKPTFIEEKGVSKALKSII